MPQVILAILAVLLAIFIVVFVVWTIIALIVRIFAWVLIAWIVTFAVGLVCGVLRGVFLPPAVLSERTPEVPEIATPDAVTDGKVLGKAPMGPAKHFGWDHAWPLYVPHQAKRDANAVLAAAKRISVDALAPALGRWSMAFLLLPAVTGFAVGLCASVLGWYLVMGLIGGAVHLVQRLGVLGYRWYDHLTRRRRKADLRCVKCYRITVLPGYRCSGPRCSTIHHDVRPGPLGIVHRRCGCGTRIPVAVGGAAERLVTVCPFCLEDAPEGSGTRRVLPLPVIGAVSAGKTQFLAAGVVELGNRAESLTGSLTPISSGAQGFVRTATTAVSNGQRAEKTAWEDRPEGVPLILSLPGREVEVQIMDAAGENFVSWERSQALGYIDTGAVLLFILDPLALPEVHERLRLAQQEGAVPLAQGDQEDAYASVIDRLRAEGVRLDVKRLAVVLTKLDVLRRLPDTEGIDPEDAATVKGWLRANGAHGFVRRINRDFRQVDYFAVDSLGPREGTDPSHPVRVFDWALRTTDPRLAVLGRPRAVPTGEEQVT